MLELELSRTSAEMKSLEIAANRASAEAEGGGEALDDMKEKFATAEKSADELQRKVQCVTIIFSISLFPPFSLFFLPGVYIYIYYKKGIVC